MANLNTSTLPDLVAQGEIFWRKKADEVDMKMMNSGIYVVDRFGFQQGDTRIYSEIDGENYAYNKNEGDQSVEGKSQQGYTKIMTLVTRSITKTVTREMRDRNKYPEIARIWTDIGQTVLKRRELDMTHRITFGTATTYVDRDGITVDISVGDTLALFSTAHTLRGTATTYRNIVPGNPQISKGALEGAENVAVTNTLNQFGEKMQVRYDILFTTDDPNTVNTAREFLKSTAAISAPNAGVVNVYEGKYRHEVLPLLATDAYGSPDSTKAKYWGLCASTDTPLRASIEIDLDVKTPAAMTNAEDILTDDWVYKALGSYGLIGLSGRGIILSQGTGAA